jgi:hypothetical protein
MNADKSISIGAKARFKVVHDPGNYPLAGERRMTKFEVQFGLRYNTFNNGTIIEDEVTGTRHQVVIKHIFKETNTGGMLALLESDLVPSHPMINPDSKEDERAE